MKILVLNSGSSSLKYQMINPEKEEFLAKGVVERIGMAGAMLTHKPKDKEKVRLTGEILDHKVAIEYVLSILLSKNHGVLKNKSEISAVGHRVVHGGESFSASQLITSDVIKEIANCIEFAPLHNPANLKGIRATQAILPNIPEVAVFDTAFHQSMPQEAFIYGLPFVLYKRHGIRRYGFHGTSHLFVTERAAKFLKKPVNKLKIITCHLGNGSSIAAVKNGNSIDTSMGFTPLEGLLMGTRSGDIDPGLFNFLTTQLDYSAQQIDDLLNQKSGLLGISELSNDCRTIEEAATAGNQQAALALDMFCYRLSKQIASYMVPLQRLDALIFTGGIGENSDIIRKKVITQLGFLGMECDTQANLDARFGQQGVISTEQSRIKAVVMPTNEEWVIALDSANIVKEL